MSQEVAARESVNRWWQKRNLAVEFMLVALPKILNGVGLILINGIALHVLGPAGFGVFSICSMAILLTDGILGSAFDMGVVRLVPTLRADEPDKAVPRPQRDWPHLSGGRADKPDGAVSAPEPDQRHLACGRTCEPDVLEPGVQPDQRPHPSGGADEPDKAVPRRQPD